MKATAVKERPVLFSLEMVKAILDGRKRMTRRIVKPQPRYETPWWFLESSKPFRMADGTVCSTLQTNIDEQLREALLLLCPFAVGMRLWVREAWMPKNWDDSGFRQMGFPDAPFHPTETYLGDRTRAIHKASAKRDDFGPWRPSIHMPRWASRITLEITDVRVERLSDISEDDAKAEGVPQSLMAATYRVGFFNLWNSLHGCNADELNPWVWVITFKRCEAQP